LIRSTALILDPGAGGRPLLQTADSILRSRRAPARTFILSAAGLVPPLVDSVAARLSASVVSSQPASDVVAARQLLFLRAGYMLDDVFLERCEAEFARDASVAAVAPAIRLQRADATAHLEWRPAAATLADVVKDTRSVPPIFAVRRDLADAVGGLDPSFGDLAAYEFWIRLLLGGNRIVVLEQALVARDIAGVRQPAVEDERHVRLFRAVLQKHAHAIERVMREALVGREVRFGQLREVHRELLAKRDAGLAELDRLRAEAAHLRAYVAHHGRTDVDWGDLRRTDPISREWGYDRGEPVDRRHIHDFLAAHSSDVRGSVLEVQEDDLTWAYGGPRVSAATVVDIDPSNVRATVLADLRCAPALSSEQFDCIILTQTLHVIDDMTAALRECHRMLKPGGILLATLPAASRVCLEYGQEGDLWRATPAGARSLFRSAFAPSTIMTEAFGNVLTNTAFLHGLASSELADADFEPSDPYFPVVTGVRARKGPDAPTRDVRGVVLLYHRVEDHSDVHDLAVPRGLFETQLAWLRHECDVVPLDMLLSTPIEALPRRALALTFDDGYLDSLTTIAPLLQKYQLPATFFLTTRWLDDQGEYWWDLLERVMLSAPSVPPSFTLANGNGTETLPTATHEQRTLAHARLHNLMVHSRLDVRDALAGQLASWAGAASRRLRPMNAGEVRQLAAVPHVAIGAHTVNHLALPDQDVEVVRQEIQHSCSTLAQLAGKPVNVFAYPYGAYDRASSGVVRRFCRWGLACDGRVLGESFDAAGVPRLEVKRWDWLELASRLEPLFHPAPASARRAFAGP
jgi:peptidoglycan/xylan/chitin deacetylase (PgdA/CDA1 family)